MEVVLFKLDRLNLTVTENFPVNKQGIENLARSLFGYVPDVVASKARHYPAGWSIGNDGALLGFVACGASHRRCMVEITGRGCDIVDVGAVYHFARSNDGRITRVDVAVDYVSGYDIRKGLADAKAGRFQNADRRAGFAESQSIERQGTWDFKAAGENKGRTVYVRSASYDVCIYEKGIKEGGNPQWVRVEVRVKKESNLPLEALKDVRSVWLRYAGFLKPDESRSVLPSLRRAQGVSSLATRIRQARAMAGRLLADLKRSGVADSDIVGLLIANGGDAIPPDELAEARLEVQDREWGDDIPF